MNRQKQYIYRDLCRGAGGCGGSAPFSGISGTASAADREHRNDTKRQILAAALITPAPGENVADLYGSHITDSFIVNASGDRVESGEKAFDVKVANEVKKTTYRNVSSRSSSAPPTTV